MSNSLLTALAGSRAASESRDLPEAGDDICFGIGVYYHARTHTLSLNTRSGIGELVHLWDISIQMCWCNNRILEATEDFPGLLQGVHIDIQTSPYRR